jgi:hypothetical protein
VTKSNLLTALTDKYGSPRADSPIAKDVGNGLHFVDYEWKWIFPTTIISLGYIDYGSSAENGVTGIVSLGYRLRRKSDVL